MTTENQPSLQPQTLNPQCLDKDLIAKFNLTNEQCLAIQRYLPKRYAFVEYESVNNEVESTSPVQLAPVKVHKTSPAPKKMHNDNDISTRPRRNPTKKYDKFLEQQLPRERKTKEGQISAVQDEFLQCRFILVKLKEHENASLFANFNDLVKEGDINQEYEKIRTEVDFTIIEKRLNTGFYKYPHQFHEQIEAVWRNHKIYHEPHTPMYLLTNEIQKYYEELLKIKNYKKEMRRYEEKQLSANKYDKIEPQGENISKSKPDLIDQDNEIVEKQ